MICRKSIHFRNIAGRDPYESFGDRPQSRHSRSRDVLATITVLVSPGDLVGPRPPFSGRWLVRYGVGGEVDDGETSSVFVKETVLVGPSSVTVLLSVRTRFLTQYASVHRPGVPVSLSGIVLSQSRSHPKLPSR